MIKKHFYSIIAKLTVILIVMTSTPVWAEENPEALVSENEVTVSEAVAETEAEAAGDETEPPFIETLQTFAYGNKDNPELVTNTYQNKYVKSHGVTPEEDANIPLNGKNFVFWPSSREAAPKIMFKAIANRDDVEFEFERLNRKYGNVEFSTGRIKENYYVCEHTGIYRIHIYATDGSGHELIYYTYPEGLDQTNPEIYNITFAYYGQSRTAKDGSTVYEGGRLTVNGAADAGVGLHEKAFMFDYPNGEWQESRSLEARPGTFHLGTRDKVGNVRIDLVTVYNVDPFPPLTTFEDITENPVNGYSKNVSMKVIADDTTGIPDRYISLDGSEWLEGDTIEISENGIYDVYTRDVFGRVSENSVEVTSIDREAPELSWNIEHISRGGGYSAKEVLHVIPFDPKSGLQGAAYSYDRGKTWVEEDSLAISENGTYPVCVRDALGNVSEIREIEVKDIDNKRPRITSVYETRQNISGKYASASKIIVTAEDDESGLHDEAAFFEGRGVWSRDMSILAQKSGVYPFRIRDRVGNMESSSITVQNIDSEPPLCEIKGNPESLTMSKVTLRLEAKDMLSGLKSIYMADAKAGVKKLLKDYPRGGEGAGQSEDSINVEITANGEYLFYLSDMCGNEKKESVTVTKIIKPKKSSKPADSPEEDEGGAGGGSGGGSVKKPKTGDSPGNETVIIGTGDGKKEKKTGSTTGITVRNGSISEEKIEKSSEKVLSGNSVTRREDDGTGLFEEEEPAGNELTDEYDSSGFSTDVFEGEDEDHFAENEPHELEMLPNPDEIETKEAGSSKGGIIAATVVLMVLALSALTVFLLSKKGLIDLSEIFGKKSEE